MSTSAMRLAMIDDLKAAKDRIAQLEAQLGKAKQRHKVELGDVSANAELALEKLYSQLSTATKRAEEAEALLKLCRTLKDKVKEELDSAHREAAGLREALKEVMPWARGFITKSSTESISFHAAINQAQAALNSTTAGKDRLKEELAKVTAHRDALLQTYKDTLTVNQDLNDKLDHAQAACAEKEDRISTLERELSDAKARFAHLIEDHETVTIDRDRNEADLQLATAESAGLRRAIEDVLGTEGPISVSRKSYSALEAAINFTTLGQSFLDERERMRNELLRLRDVVCEEDAGLIDNALAKGEAK